MKVPDDTKRSLHEMTDVIDNKDFLGKHGQFGHLDSSDIICVHMPDETPHEFIAIRSNASIGRFWFIDETYDYLFPCL